MTVHFTEIMGTILVSVGQLCIDCWQDVDKYAMLGKSAFFCSVVDRSING